MQKSSYTIILKQKCRRLLIRHKRFISLISFRLESDGTTYFFDTSHITEIFVHLVTPTKILDKVTLSRV